MPKIQYKAYATKIKIKNIVFTLKSIDKHHDHDSSNLFCGTGFATSLNRSTISSEFQLSAIERFENHDV